MMSSPKTSPHSSKPLSDQHRRRVLGSARHELREWWSLVTRNVTKPTQPPRKKRRELRIFVPTEARMFVGACEDHRLGELFVTMLGLGVRIGEALGLFWGD